MLWVGTIRYKNSQMTKLKSPFLISAEQQPLQTCNGPWWQTCSFRRRTEKIRAYTGIHSSMASWEIHHESRSLKKYHIGKWMNMKEIFQQTGGNSWKLFTNGKFKLPLLPWQWVFILLSILNTKNSQKHGLQSVFSDSIRKWFWEILGFSYSSHLSRKIHHRSNSEWTPC